MELKQEYVDVLEALKWSVSNYTDDGRVELQRRSSAGDDFNICVEVKSLPKS